jgi:hypothetical protein
MKHVILVSIAAGALAAFAAAPAAAQNATADANASANANAGNGFTAKTVDPVRPFGSINVYNVGLEPAQVSAWAKTLDGGQKQEMIGRCAVIVQNQHNYFAETTDFCQTFAIAIAQTTSGNGDAGK